MFGKTGKHLHVRGMRRALQTLALCVNLLALGGLANGRRVDIVCLGVSCASTLLSAPATAGVVSLLVTPNASLISGVSSSLGLQMVHGVVQEEKPANLAESGASGAERSDGAPAFTFEKLLRMERVDSVEVGLVALNP